MGEFLMNMNRRIDFCRYLVNKMAISERKKKVYLRFYRIILGII